MGAVGGRSEFLARISWHVTDRKLRVRIHRTEKGQWQIFHVYFEHRENLPAPFAKKTLSFSYLCLRTLCFEL